MPLATVLLFIASMATLGFADFATKQASGRISPALGTLIYAASAMMPALAWIIWTRARASGRDAWKGVNLSLGVPVIRLGGIARASVLGIIVLREPISFQSLGGFALAALGIVLIATR